MSVCAILVAAGRSERMDGVDKIFAPLVGRPLIIWPLTALTKCEDIDSIVVVAAPPALGRMRDLIEEWRMAKVVAVVAGGENRQESVRAGLDAARDAGVVVIHDAARPLVSPDLVSRGIAIARQTGAALCAVRATDTVKEADGDPPVVRATHDRTRIWLAQTPQVFSRELLAEAHAAAKDPLTDDAALVESLGHAVSIYEGAVWNLKVTSPHDLVVADALLHERLQA